MNSNEIKELFERKARAMTRRPAFGRAIGQARIRMSDGFSCEVEHDDRTFRVDQPVSEGGGGAGPHPGQLMRASLGACLAMGYRIWGARLGVAIDAVEVEMICDYDARGYMGVSEDVAIGWQQVRFDVKVTSAEPEEAVRRVVATADRLSPMLANLASTVRRVHHLTIVRPEGK
jgi:uncharacterized OsmC-like protein